MADPVTILVAVDADLEQVRLEAIRSASQQGTHLVGDPDIQTTGTVIANDETVVLDGSGLALYTWATFRTFASSDNISPALLPPRVL